ncbi:hypothetical protein [Roseovarius aestuarii]|uniref:Uncharacterized protein n=1 Tax=Roseovarius aestuarii TaxID=475083 RepID=A0A1X7BUD0_9RHOB|nr:hypothetical protein [Roseovarius aestuarii]SMC13184.1 hypothetical protein ROA7745_03025 [Roseovarius aestuarii]
MAQTSFTERLERIEMSRGQPASARLLAGISEEQKKLETKPKAGGGRAGFKPMRFVVGFALMYAGMMVVSRMTEINGWLGHSDIFAPFATPVMAGIAIAIVFLMLFFAFKLQRAAFRVLSEPARLVFASGMVLGFALGFGPAEFSESVMAQLQ